VTGLSFNPCGASDKLAGSSKYGETSTDSLEVTDGGEMELKFPLGGDFGFAPGLVRILNSIGDAECNHNHYALRHPMDIFHAVISEVGDHFQRLLDVILPFEQTPTNGSDLNEESLRIYRDLIASLARYVDCGYEVILALCDKRPIAAGDRKFLYKWLKKQRFNSGAMYYNIIKAEIALFREENNSLKHSSDALRPVTVLISSRPHLGYFVEGASSDGTVGPSRVFHDSANGQVAANSFNRDLRLLYHCIYLVADALRRAVLVHYKSLHNQDPPDNPNGRYDDAYLRALFNKVALLPSVFYPKEGGKIVPIAAIDHGPHGPVMKFTETRAATIRGVLTMSAGGVMPRGGKMQLPLP